MKFALLSFTHPHIILMIGDDGVVVVPHDIASAAPFFVPTENKHAAAEITDFVGRYPQARVTLFADNLAQDYRSDILPRLNFFDRAKLAHRRLKQNFPLARLAAYVDFKKDPNRILMIGLHDSNPVFAWAERLRGRLPTIQLLPVEGARIVGKLMPDATKGWAMLVSRQKSGGFRQIVTHGGGLVFTRLTPLPPSDASHDDAEIIARDIKASLDYLTRHGLRDSKELAVLLLMPNALHADSVLADLPLKSIRSQSPFAAAQELALPFAPQAGDDAADLLFAAHLVTAFPPALSLMLPDMRQIWLTQAIRQWGLRVACACVGAVALMTLWNAGDLITTLYQAQKESAQLEDVRRTLAEAQANAAPVTEPLGRMRQALQRKHIYEQTTPTPWQGIDELSDGLSADVKIVRLDWKKDGDAAPELFNISLRVAAGITGDDRAETVAAFTRATQNIARAMPDYAVSVTKPPYPALPQESVSAASTAPNDPVGEIALQRKQP